jgi:HSP20 family protein
MFRRFMTPRLFDKDLFEGMDVRVDVVEKDGSYKVRADLPGVKKENINVRIDGNIVHIDAETQDAKEFKEEGGKVLRSERYYGAVSRSFSLADDVDESKATAKYSDGVLTLDLPKKAASSSGAHRITIQ